MRISVHRFSWLLLFLCGAVVASPVSAVAAEIAVSAQPVSIARAATRAFEFGNVPQKNTTALLKITSRLDATALAGSNFMMRLTLNGQEVQGAKTRSAVRLKNRALDSPVAPNIPAPWFGSPPGWRVLYAPDFDGAKAQTFYEGDPYTLVLDVTDLLNPAAENRLEITNTALDISAAAAQTQADLVVQNISLETVEGASPMMVSAANVKPFINTGQRAGGPAKYTAQVAPGGGFTVTVGKRQWKFSSAFSYPNAGFNRLTAAPQKNSGQSAWKPTTKREPRGAQVTASAREYSLRRTLKFTPRKIEVADAITNKTAAPLGLVVSHETSLAGLDSPPVRLAGNPDQTLSQYFAPGNPSVHVTAPGHTIAMLCEDDVLRNQARLFVRASPTNAAENATGFRTEMLRLAPGETYTLRWSVYPVQSLDYFDFVNLVRQDWGANFTTQGAWWWGFSPDEVLAMPLEMLRAKLQRQGIRYATIGGGWVDNTKDRKRIGFGTGVMDDYWADYRRRVRDAGDKLRLAIPGMRVLAYYDAQRDTSEGGATRFRDSALTGVDDQPLSTEWSGEYSRTESMVATLDNSYGKAMLEVADRYMTEMKLDGLYWDEMENVAFNEPLLTYNAADGRTCLLDLKTFTIKRSVGLTTLLGESHRLAVVARVQKRGGIVLGNGPTTTRALLATQVQRMIESQHNDYFPYEGNLQTPLGYIGGETQWKNYPRLFNLAVLPVTAGIDIPHDIGRHLFPFTPIELHSGYLLGRERIIATHDGTYGWDGKFRYRLWTYDEIGKKLDENPAWQTASKRVPVKVPVGGAVIMEREIAPPK